MIKAENGNVSLEGNVPGLLTDLTFVVKAMKEAFEEKNVKNGEERIKEAIDMGFMTAGQTEDYIETQLERILTELVSRRKEKEDADNG